MVDLVHVDILVADHAPRLGHDQVEVEAGLGVSVEGWLGGEERVLVGVERSGGGGRGGSQGAQGRHRLRGGGVGGEEGGPADGY